MKENNIQIPDSTAVRTALWRALHVLTDPEPHVFNDVAGLKMIAPPADRFEQPDMKFTKRIRASIVARARYIEDLVIEQQSDGVQQYVLLGAGLDTFAQRRPETASKLQIFEIDRPETLNWKQNRLTELGYGLPDYLHFVPVNFETSSWFEELLKAGFDIKKPAVIACTGVTLYLTKDAIITTLRQTASFAFGSTLAITFNLPVELCNDEDKPLIEMSVNGAKASGTPMISFFSPNEVLEMARQAGFSSAKTISTKEMKDMYFANRQDELVPASGEFFLVGKIF